MMRTFFKSLLTPTGELSLGSVCIFFMVVIYSGLMIAAFVLKRTLPVTGFEFASIVAAIYGIKQGSYVAQTYYNQKGAVPDASIRD